MFSTLFLSVLNMSITASLVMVIVLVVRFLLKKSPKIFSYALWIVVLYRLICPFTFESAVSLLPINETPIPHDIVYSTEPQINTGLNIVDNAIYWTSSQREIVDKKEFKSRIYITTNTKDFGGNAIIIADNGEGFKLEEDELKQPFKTTRPNGMGLGLYFVELVMNMLGGKLIFLNSDEIELPKGLDGAVVVLVFPKNQ